jgi:hypothetical protein
MLSANNTTQHIPQGGIRMPKEAASPAVKELIRHAVQFGMTVGNSLPPDALKDANGIKITTNSYLNSLGLD